MTEFKMLESDTDSNQYNQVVNHPFQSWEYGEVLAKLGYPVVRFGQFRQQQLIQGFQFSLHKLPYTNSYLAFLARGMLPSNKQLEIIKSTLKKLSVVFARLEFYVEKSLGITIPPSLLLAPDSLTYNYTMQIDLTRSQSQLLAGLKPKARYNLYLAMKNNVVVKEQTNQAGYRIFSQLLMETCQRKGFYAKSPRFHKALLNGLKQQQVHILVASHKNKPLAAYEILIFNQRAHFVFGGSAYKFRSLMGTNLLMWQTLLFSKAMGCHIFDFSETLGPDYDPLHSWAGLTRFAASYQGRFVQLLPNYDLVISAPEYRLYNEVIRKIMQSFANSKGYRIGYE